MSGTTVLGILLIAFGALAVAIVAAMFLWALARMDAISGARTLA